MYKRTKILLLVAFFFSAVALLSFVFAVIFCLVDAFLY